VGLRIKVVSACSQGVRYCCQDVQCVCVCVNVFYLLKHAIVWAQGPFSLRRQGRWCLLKTLDVKIINSIRNNMKYEKKYCQIATPAEEVSERGSVSLACLEHFVLILEALKHEGETDKKQCEGRQYLHRYFTMIGLLTAQVYL